MVTTPLLAIGTALMVALGVQQVTSGPTPTSASSKATPDTSTSGPAPSSEEPSAGSVAFRGKRVPDTVDDTWTLRADDPTLSDDFSGYYSDDNRTVNVELASGDDSVFRAQVERLTDRTQIGNVTCGTNPNNDLAYCFVQGSDNTYLRLFSSSTEAADIGALAQEVVAGLA